MASTQTIGIKTVNERISHASRNCPTGMSQRSTRAIPEHDALAAGCPCQPCSIAGVSKKRASGAPRGLRAKRRERFLRRLPHIEGQQARGIPAENVNNLCGHDQSRAFEVIRESPGKPRCEIFYRVIPVIEGQSFVPQHRKEY